MLRSSEVAKMVACLPLELNPSCGLAAHPDMASVTDGYGLCVERETEGERGRGSERELVRQSGSQAVRQTDRVAQVGRHKSMARIWQP